MALGFIIALILIGVVLIFIEMLLVPGTHLFAILGGIAIVAGVILIYNAYGSYWGNISAFVALLAFIVAIVAGFKVIESNKMAMKAEINSKVNMLEKYLYSIGDRGVATSELRPHGKAIFGDNKIDVYSTGEYIKRDTDVEIVKISNDKIFVQPVKK
jgi:membrane-bound ClpP family serine protease